MMIYRFTEAPLDNNNYLIFDEESRDAALVDCSAEDQAIIDCLEKNNLQLKYILLTHAHFDHIGAVSYFKKKYCPTVCLNSADDNLMSQINLWQIQMGFPKTEVPVADKVVNEDTELKLGKDTIKVIATPGHTPGGVCYLCNNHLFSGDTLFRGAYGRVDLPDSNAHDMASSLKELIRLPEDTIVHPGHGEESTIDLEQQNIQRYLSTSLRY